MAATGAQGLAVVAFSEGSSTLTLYAMLSHGGNRCARAGMAGGLLDTQIVCNATLWNGYAEGEMKDTIVAVHLAG